MDKQTLVALGTAAALVVLGAWNVYKWWREYSMRKKYKLGPNPERCEDHEQRIRAVENTESTLKGDIGIIKTDIQWIKHHLEGRPR